MKGAYLVKRNIEKNLTMPKKLKGGPFGAFQHPFCRKTLKMKGPSGGNIFFRKKSHRAENTLREFLLVPLSFFDDVKILLRKLKTDYPL